MLGSNATTDGSLEPAEPWLRSLAALLGPGSGRASAWIAAGTVVDATYRVERPLAAGGMAVIYLARDLELDRLLALKVYDLDARDLPLSRIYREARAMAKLSHPNVLVVHGVGIHAERMFLAMEYVEGNTLRGWWSDESRAWPDVVAMFLQCGRGLAAAHAVGIVHGDFKPDNVLVGRDGRARVADFGLARTIDVEHDAAARSGDDAPGATSRFAGTPIYAAPEQHAGGEPDVRADQFSFCVALHEALYGAHPFEGDDATARAEAIRDGRLRARPPRGTVPSRVHEIVMRGLARDPAARFASIDELVTRLERAPTRRWVRVAVPAVMVTSIGALAWPRADACDQSDAAIDDVWNPARSAALATAFEASGSPVGEDAHRAVVGRIDAWADAWRAQRRDACEATRVRGEQSDALLDRRMLCLDHQLTRLGVGLDALEHADRDAVANADDLVAGLPGPPRCAEVERLLAAVAPPDDPALAERVERDRRELARGDTAIALGRYPDAIAIARDIADGEAARDYPPLRAEASLVLGIAQWRAFEPDVGEAALTDAFHRAVAAGDDDVATVAARELVCNLSLLSASTERAAWWSRTAESAGTRAHVGEAERLELEACRGFMHYAAGEYAEAEAVYREALARVDDADDPEHLLAATLHDRLGATLFAMLHFEEAAAEHDLAYELARAVRGPTNPLVVVARSNYAQALGRLGRAGEALAIQRDVLATFVELYGPDSGRLINSYSTVAQALAEVGDLQGAIEERGRAIAIARARPDQRRTLVLLLSNQAVNIQESGDLERALPLAAESVTIADEAIGPTHPDTGKALLNYGSLLASSGRNAEAEHVLRRGLDVLAASLGDTHAAVGFVWVNLATLAIMAGRSDDAQSDLDAAVRVAKANDDARLEAIVEFTRADVLRTGGDRERARDHMRSGVALVHDVDAMLEREVLRQLGEDELALGDREAAMRAFARARELALEQGASAVVPEIDEQIARVTVGSRRSSTGPEHP